MRVESLGHESWLIGEPQARVLIDPLLSRTFGNSARYVFEKTSHRELSTEELQSVRAVVLTTEHFQHFDRKSLSLLGKSVRVFVSATFGSADAAWLQSEGFHWTRVPFGEVFSIAGLECIFIPGSLETPKWDCRVSSLAVCTSEPKHWCFFQSDTAPLTRLADVVPEHWPRKPALVAVTCHRKEYERAGHSSWDNLISTEQSLRDPRAAMSFVRSVMPFDVFPLNVASRYALCGGDYFKSGRRPPVALRDNRDLAEMAQALALNSHVSFAAAGAVVDLRSNAFVPAQGGPESYGEFLEPFSVLEPHPQWSETDDRRDLDSALRRLSTALLLSDLGHYLTFCDEYLGRQLSSRRFVLNLVHPHGSETYEFCLAEGAFVRTSISGDDLLSFPAGLILARSALVDIQRRIASAAEVCSYNAVHWTAGASTTLPLGLVYSAFSAATSS